MCYNFKYILKNQRGRAQGSLRKGADLEFALLPTTSSCGHSPSLRLSGASVVLYYQEVNKALVGEETCPQPVVAEQRS